MPKAKEIEINPRYDMTYDKLSEIRKSANGTLDAIYSAFQLGYQRGTRAERAAVRAARRKKERCSA